MTLTSAAVEDFAGGQIKQQDPTSVFCGEIKEITVIGTGNSAKLKIVLNWKAWGQGRSLMNPDWWLNDPTGLDLEIELVHFRATMTKRGCMNLGNNITRVNILLYPPHAPTLKRRDVVGLV